jgi:hypothetical protein
VSSLLGSLKKKLRKVLPLLNERQRRILIATEARAWGWGGTKTLSRITGVSHVTIRRGLVELEETFHDVIRIRKPGGGRKNVVDKNPRLKGALEKLIDPATRGDPESPLRWVSKSTRHLEQTLKDKGFVIGRTAVNQLLKEMEYSLQANKKTQEGKSHGDRDGQFQYINDCAKTFLGSRQPVIPVDTKKKELVGNYKNVGRELEPRGQPLEVKGHDFPTGISKAIPYGVYDIGDNRGWVNVGTHSDTAEFAVESIRFWWKEMGKGRYAKARELLICADSGGSNGYRSHLWKAELQKFSNQERLKISVRHFPPGTSKWNKIEHKLFSFISMNWRGKPLRTYRTVVKLIAATTTTAGLTVKVRLDKRKYKKGIEVSEEVLQSLNLSQHEFHGEWNYTIAPNK